MRPCFGGLNWHIDLLLLNNLKIVEEKRKHKTKKQSVTV